jgi:ABC-type transporter Mla subunit MlaD
VTHPTPPLELQLRVTDSAAVLLSLAQRRAAWLEASLKSTDDRSALADIGTAIDHAFDEAATHAQTLRDVFQEYGSWCNEQIATALSSGQFGDSERAAFARVIRVDDGDYAARGVALASTVIEGGLRADLRNRVAGLVLASDEINWGCAAMAFAAMGGLAMCPKTLGAGCALGAGAMITLAAFC